ARQIRSTHSFPTRRSSDLVNEGFETIVAGGGDGTINEVLNGIGDAPGGFDKSRLGVLPLGTVNVFAREMAIPPELEKAWPIILRSEEHTSELQSRSDLVCR